MSSSDPDWQASPEPASPVSPRKRRRSSSADLGRQRKRTLTATYNDAYRVLYNDFVQTVTSDSYVTGDSSFDKSQLGVTFWTGLEKKSFFRAIERLGQDNLPGIASAVGSKSILEVRQFLVLLQDACNDRVGKRDISLTDIPSAAEVGIVCERQLDAAGDTLASKQERFEATQEQKRYGEHWLITSELADEIEVSAQGLRASVLVESGDEGDRLNAANDAPLLRAIPEANLLIPKSFLELSRNLFMNGPSDASYPWPNWRDLASDLATEPCMYRTAFRDFYALVLSFTKRVMQTALIQATSRIRSQGWRVKKGVKLFVRSRDVHMAADLLGVKGSRRRFFRQVPRRCRLRVTEGRYRKTRVLPWDEVERIMDATEGRSTPLESDTDTEHHDTQAKQAEFKSRAARTGTPLPSVRRGSSDGSVNEDVEDDAESLVDGSDSDTEQILNDSLENSDANSENSYPDSSEDELEELEKFDQEASRLEERRLWAVLGDSPPDDDNEMEPEAATENLIRNIPRRRNKAESDDWRGWTQYYPEREALRSQIPPSSFLANRKPPSPSREFEPPTDYETDYGTETGISSGGDRKLRKRLPVRTIEELPLRDPRSYAALRGEQTMSAEPDVESNDSNDEANIPAPSIEDGSEEASEMSIVEAGTI